MQRKMSNWLYFGLWSVILLAALVLQLMPFFFVFMVFSLAIGFSKGTAMFVFPIVFMCMVAAGCVIASKFAGRLATRLRLDRRGAGDRPRSHWAMMGNPLSPSQYYRDLKRLS